MRRAYKLYLEDILSSIQKIQNYAGNTSLENIIKDGMRIDALAPFAR